jgi:hypothetical protein
LPPHQGRLVRRRNHHDRAGETGIAQVLLQEFLDLAAALAHQANDRDIGLDIAGQHREQYRFADPGAGKDADALAAAARHERVEHAHAEVERAADPSSRMRRRRACPERKRRRTDRQRALASIGSPMALTTRPSQVGDGRTAPATELTTARQPRRTPSKGANGIRRAWGPEKPTTSQGIGRPLPLSMTTRAPTDMA